MFNDDYRSLFYHPTRAYSSKWRNGKRILLYTVCDSCVTLKTLFISLLLSKSKSRATIPCSPTFGSIRWNRLEVVSYLQVHSVLMESPFMSIFIDFTYKMLSHQSDLHASRRSLPRQSPTSSTSVYSNPSCPTSSSHQHPFHPICA